MEIQIEPLARISKFSDCAKRSLRPSGSQNKVFRVSVRSFVRKVITFCEEDMRGDHVPLDLGVLNDRFLGFEKFLKSFEKKCSKCTYQWGLLEVKIRF